MKKIGILFILILSFQIIAFNSELLKITKKDGVTTFRNKNIPSDPNFEIILTKSFDFQIQPENQENNFFIKSLSQLKTDQLDNIFILDGNRSKFYKFDSKGKYIKTFANKGNGPGEFEWCFDFYINKDTICVSSSNESKIHKFDLSGNYIYSKKTIARSPNNIIPLENVFLCLDSEHEVKGGIISVVKSISIYSNSMEKKVELLKKSIKDINKDPQKNRTYFIGKKENIYISDYSEDYYKINVYNLKGEIKSIIEKQQIKIKLTKEEINKLNNSFSYSVKGKISKGKVSSRYLQIITDIQLDKYSRLWISSNVRDREQNSDYHFDVFVDNSFINRIKLDLIEDERIIGFRGDYLVTFNEDQGIVSFYNY